MHFAAAMFLFHAKIKNMKKIIAPVDFSETSANSAIFAGNLAEFYGAELLLYHAYELAIPVSAFGYPFVTPHEMQDAANYELEQFKQRVQDALRRTITIHTLAEGAVLTDGLSALCQQQKPDMIVMGLSGKNALTRLVVGSNTIKAIRQLTCPVLVVPPKAQFIPVRKVCFACDYEKVVETTPVGPLKQLLTDFNAELHILNIVFEDDETRAEKVPAGMYINELLKAFKPEYHTLLSSDITYSINWFAEKEAIDWIVVIPKKHNLVDRLFSRSKTQDLIHHTHTPVLCMHE
jgi:nucleotide-binding universal stress UspA family protein